MFSNLQAQLNFSDNFENGRLDTFFLDSGSHQLWPIDNLHFRISGAKNQQPQFKIYDSSGYRLRSYHHMVYRYAGDSLWQFFDTAHKAQAFGYYHFYNQQTFNHDTVYIAYWFPYTYSNLQQFISTIANNPYVQNAGTKTSSYQGRNIYGYTISDTSVADCYKKNVVITVRQHPTENISGYYAQGMSEFLLSADTAAAFLRKNYRFFFYPMLNPDGVVNGSETNALGQGLNREWEDSLLAGGTPEIDSIRPVIWQETKGQVDYSIDIHGNFGSNIKYYWWGYTSTSPVSPLELQRSTQYAQAVAAVDGVHNAVSLFQNYVQGNGASNSLTAANWFRKSFGAVAFTFEPTSEPLGSTGNNRISTNRMKSAGASLARAFYSVYDTLPALEMELISNGDSARMIVNGGKEPYQYTWLGSKSGIHDTIRNLPGGKYRAIVSDANGCSFTKRFIVASQVSQQEIKYSGASIFPNPGQNYFTIMGLIEKVDQVQVYNSSGQLILVSRHAKRINTSALTDGFYHVRIKLKKGQTALNFKWLKNGH